MDGIGIRKSKRGSPVHSCVGEDYVARELDRTARNGEFEIIMSRYFLMSPLPPLMFVIHSIRLGIYLYISFMNT